jgi:DNA repair protein RadD
MITPRPYQMDGITGIRTELKNGANCVVYVLSTGGGKSVILMYIASNAEKKGSITYAVAHKAELIEQLSLTLCKAGVEHNLIVPQNKLAAIKMAQYRAFGRIFYNPNSNTYVGSVQTINKRLDSLPSANLIILDEGHHYVEDSEWSQIIERNPSAKSLLLTATPARTDKKGLGRGFGGFADAMVVGPSMGWLIGEKYLSPYKAYTTSRQWDLTGVKKSKKDGDFTSKSLDKVMDKPSITGDAIATYKNGPAFGLKAICFSVSIEASRYTAEKMNQNGVSAIHIDGSMKDGERRQAIRDYAEGKYMVLCCESLVDEGFDLEAISQIEGATIDVLIDLSPTLSLIRFMQRCGRVLRYKPGKVAYIYDHAGNFLRHGLPDMEREWSLEGEVKSKKNGGEKAISVRTCSKCYHIHLPEPQCPSCGFVYPIQQRVIEEKEGELVELSKEDKERIKYEMQWQKKREQSRAESLEELIELGRSRGYKNPKGWALRIHHARELKKIA